MKLESITIENFKSIKEIKFDLQKWGNSFTTMLLGMNESGKSNILEAMSFFKTPSEEFDYYAYHNQKDDENTYIDLYFHMSCENKHKYVRALTKNMINGELLYFEVKSLVKNVYLSQKSDHFKEIYHYELEKLTPGLFIARHTKTISLANGGTRNIETFKILKNQENESDKELTEENFKEILGDALIEIIKQNEPKVTFWKPSSEYLINSEDLKEFADRPYSKPALKNIFMLAGYENSEKISQVIETIENGQLRSKLKSKLEDALNEYITEVWEHNIDIVIDITETGILTLSIKDKGKANKHDRLPINGRSEGARHFLSLILSLSIESKHKKRTNQLILIDEPEAHLHPSGIRNLKDELLRIGESNYLFVSTHSPFLVDRKTKERNIIIKKDREALTHKLIIDKDTSTIDDEVLREAFGIEVYKDLLNPHSILVEGASDKKIIQKILNVKRKNDFGITNGHGTNIDTLASKLNDADISILVVADDDRDGNKYKDKIIKIGGSYSESNVMTLRDLVGDVCSGATIEDFLGSEYLSSCFNNHYKSYYEEPNPNLELQEGEPFLKQIQIWLNRHGKKDHDKFLEQLKEKVSNELEIPKTTYKTRFPYLNALGEALISKLT